MITGWDNRWGRAAEAGPSDGAGQQRPIGEEPADWKSGRVAASWGSGELGSDLDFLAHQKIEI
jgi:hypothetical protein